MVLGFLWIVGAIALDLPFSVVTLPTFTFLGVIYVLTGLAYLRLPDRPATGRNLVGWAFILWGLHKLDYPFVRPLEWFAPWGYLLSSVLELVVAIGTLVLYFQRMQKELTQSEGRFRLLAEHALDVIYRFRVAPALAAEYVSPALTGVLGYRPSELYADAYVLLRAVHPDDRARFEQVLASTTATHVTLRFFHKNGSLVWVEQRNVPILDKGGQLVAMEGIARDISERQRSEEIIRHLAYHDALTDLPNRILLNDRLKQAMAHAHRKSQALAVMFLDLDDFKVINDTLGHAMGDQLLQGVARRLMACVRTDDTVVRMGGDEFTVLLPEVDQAEDAVVVAERIVESLQKPWVLGGHEFHVTASIGIAVYPLDGEDAAALMKNADTAMYGPRTPVGTPTSSTPPRCPPASWTGWRWRTACATPSRPASSASTTSLSSTRPPGPSSAPRRCCAGSIRSGG
jgi:diguanylate cyclase (GGDEF)-like protein/PAS domain S-box-containing protein